MSIKDALDGSLYGEGGNDTLNGGSLNDYLSGGDGNDTLKGNAGQDVLDGGAGNDTLNGGAGDDIYLFRLGDGQDSVNNSGGGNDLLKFEGINPEEFWFGQNGAHLTIGLVGAQDKVTVNNWFTGDNKIDVIQADSMILVETQLAQLLQALSSIGTPAGTDGQWTDQQREDLTPILSAYWRPEEI
jgi:Ca2+-binding RTX toxin-like protein